MKTVNFERFEIYTSISHESVAVRDCREWFANIIYMNGNGVACHSLAMKIYRSEGPADYTDEEISMMRQFAEKFGSLLLNDSLGINIKEKKEDTE